MADKHIHHVLRLRAGGNNRYECLDCGKKLRILSGVIVANNSKEADAYLQKKREEFLKSHMGEQ